jgi:hypothetical protein
MRALENQRRPDLRPPLAPDNLNHDTGSFDLRREQGATMGRKRTMNRMNMRGEYDEGEERQEEEAESADDEEEEDEEGEGDEEEEAEGDEEPAEGDEDEDAPPKPKKVPKKKPPKAPAKPRARASKQVRLKVVWGVFNNSNQQLATYPYPQEDEARAHAEKLIADKKTNHFVQRVKVPMEEKEKEKEK